MSTTDKPSMKKKIAIVGGGLTGIGCLVELLQAGHDARLYERNDDIGGVWHPSNCYSGLSLHGASAAFEYYDFPLPDFVDKSRPISSAQVYDYLRRYFRHKNLEAHSEFETSIEKISYSQATQKFTLHIVRRGDAGTHTAEFDYVVYTHGFVARTLPRVDGADLFAGQILHSFDLTEAKLVEFVRVNKKIVVVGGSKTATDIILRLHHHDLPATWLYRKNYWFIRSEPLIEILTQRLSGRSGGFVRRAVFVIGDFLGTKMPRVHLALWRAFGFAHTFGAKHWDFTKYHRGRIETAAMSQLKQCADQHGMIGEIASFTKDGLTLQDGRALACDVVIFCTGSGAHQDLIMVEKNGRALELTEVRRMYRSRVIPEIPKLIFTAFHLFSFGVVNGLMTGRWIARYIDSEFSEAYLAEHATTYDPPFFAQPSYLFNSSKPFNVSASEMLTPFFQSGEFSKWGYFRWLWQVSFAPKGVPPLDIAAPRKKPDA
jgi:thioredoxin reductase